MINCGESRTLTFHHLWDELVGDRIEERGIQGIAYMEEDCYYLCRRCNAVYHKTQPRPRLGDCKTVTLWSGA
jgi:hypothetical protein